MPKYPSLAAQLVGDLFRNPANPVRSRNDATLLVHAAIYAAKELEKEMGNGVKMSGNISVSSGVAEAAAQASAILTAARLKRYDFGDAADESKSESDTGTSKEADTEGEYSSRWLERAMSIRAPSELASHSAARPNRLRQPNPTELLAPELNISASTLRRLLRSYEAVTATTLPVHSRDNFKIVPEEVQRYLPTVVDLSQSMNRDEAWKVVLGL